MNVIGCMGVGCSQHQDCRCYHAVEWLGPMGMRIAFCPVKDDGTRALYVPMFVVHSKPDVEHRKVAA